MLPGPSVFNLQKTATEPIPHQYFNFRYKSIFFGHHDNMCDLTSLVQFDHYLLWVGTVSGALPGMQLGFIEIAS